MDSRIVISFGRNEALKLLQSDKTIKTFIFIMVSPSRIYIKLCYIVHNVIGGLST